MQARFALVLCLLLIALGASCGTNNVGSNGPDLSGQPQGQRAVGVAAGGFEVVRQNQQGYNDSNLNRTLELELRSLPSETALVISVDDSSFTTAVTLDVRYDASRFHPVRAEFTDLLGNREQVLTASFLDSVQGSAGLAAAAIKQYRPGPLKGEFATLYFAPGPDRDVSNAAGDAHENPLGVADILTNAGDLQNFVADTSVTDTVSLTWTSAWMIGNGDGNKEVNGADIVPIASNFQDNTATSFAAVRGDYDRNTECNGADLQRIALYYQRFTDSYLVQASDDDGNGTTQVALLDGQTDQQPAIGPPTAGNLTSLFAFWNVTIGPATTFTYAQLRALDVNANGQVSLTVTPQGTAGKLGGVAASIGVAVGSPPPTADQLVIDSFTISVTDGAGNELAVLSSGAPDFTATANGQIGFALKEIGGSFNGTPFTGRPATDPAEDDELHQADYDTAFAAAQGYIIWDFNTGGAAGARRTSEWCNFPTGSSPYLGQLTDAATIFPDYDPQSVLPGAVEGGLDCTLPIEGGSLPGGGVATYPVIPNDLEVKVLGNPVVRTFNFDIDVDAAQAQLTTYTTDDLATPMTALTLNRRNVIFCPNITWGSGGVPADFSVCSLELRRIDSSGLAVGNILSFTHVDGVSHDQLQANQFNIDARDDGSGNFTYNLAACVNGGGLLQGASYALRLNVAGTFTSINVPDNMLTTADPPPPAPMVTVPEELATTNDFIQIFYQDTTIHRDGAMIMGATPPPNPQPTFIPEDQAAFDDLLREDGFELVPNFDLTALPPSPYPIIVIKDSSLGPISGPNDPQQASGVTIVQRGANRLVVDVTPLTTGGGGPGGTPINYSYIVYDQGGIDLGTGSFQYDPVSSFPKTPAQPVWGLNVFNREIKALGSRSYTNFVVDWSAFPPGEPGVLFFEFFGGSPFDPTQNEEEVWSGFDPSKFNPYIRVYNPGNAREMNIGLGLRLGGLTPDNTFLFLHTITAQDYLNPGFPGWSGILNPGEVYDLFVVDQATTDALGIQLPNQMVVIGTNPNVP